MMLLATAAVTAACDSSPVTPGDETYALVSVDAQPLPAPLPDPLAPVNMFEVTAGSLTLRRDGTFVKRYTARCRANLPPNVECSVSGDGPQVTGTYSRADGWLQLDGRYYTAAYEQHRVVVEVALPPSIGLYPRFTAEFTR
jgi:hypothetical protein